MQKIANRAITEEDIPLCLRNRPILSQFQIQYWKAFQDVMGNCESAILYSEKVAWLNENGIDDIDERGDFLYMIAALDATYMENHYEKLKAK